MNKNIILVVLIIIVLAVLGGIIFTQLNSNVDTQINFISSNALNSGDNVTFELKDAQGNVLANEQVTILYEKDGQNQTFTVTTDNNGRGYLTLGAEETGTHQVTVNFAGHDKYNPSNATQVITIGEASSDSSQDSSQDSSSASTSSDSSTQASNSTSSSSGSQSNLHYDSELNVQYDDNGVIRGGQSDGQSYQELKNNPPEVDEDGNLV